MPTRSPLKATLPDSLQIRLLTSIRDIAAADWDACANPAGQAFNPFISHAFFDALEASGSATAQTGWLGQHLVLENPQGKALGILPLYLKNHSQGEYVFDHAFADALERAGGSYYPKLQASVPFTPATGPRLLVPPGPDEAAIKHTLANAAIRLADAREASSVHITFLPQADFDLLGADETLWLQRTDTQFHWENDGYKSFDDFLATLSSSRRKNLRKERAAALTADIEIEWLTGQSLKEAHWDAFYEFYMDTGNRKWGTPYLTRNFFSRIHETMAEHILLVMCNRNGKPIAGAFNMIGSDTLFGRNWGAVEHHPFLHFEACYYQAIDFAIARGLKHVEAGAQGGHKLARGYLPRTTRSLHHFTDPRLAQAVKQYLKAEREAVAHQQEELQAHSPFRNAD
ncbi:MAG: GNAT family N-acetyltransferase [Aestuariivirgaceae bacterium]|nr:GNAT family N-acetyltransferase [Aestuariivirgaceae bacterium]